ncbi:hypothetical protein LSAT2_019853 [Lamellibrachia satsuma]|nr:hypothetical protein LSAT2_019853 [Lamellibrachia satsuma]
MEQPAVADGNQFLSPCRWNLVQFGFICFYTMDLAATWTFPYYIYRHTVLFLVAYYVLLALLCVPVTFLQLRLGGVLRAGILNIFSHYVPALKGVAGGMLLMVFLSSVVYNVQVGYGLFYILASLKQPLPWSHLANSTPRLESNYIFLGQTPAQSYYYNIFLESSGSISWPGDVPWHLGLSLLAVWILTFLLTVRGMEGFGKLVCVSGPVSVSLLLVLLVYSHTAAPLATHALTNFYADPSEVKDSTFDILQSQLASPLMWARALEQHVGCVGLWAGILPTLGKHLGNRKPARNITWLVLLLIHSMLPHLEAITIAPFIHALAVKRNVPFEGMVLKSGPRLAFVVLPDAFAASEVSSVWVCLYYVHLVLFALHRQALVLLTIVENIAEFAPKYTQIIFRRNEVLTLTLCIFGFLLGLPHVTQGGSYLSRLLDFSLPRLLPVLAVLTTIPLVKAYVRLEPLHLPIERVFMMGWFVLASIAAAALLTYHTVAFMSPFMAQLGLPAWAITLGWFITVCPLVVSVVAGVTHALCRAKGTLPERILEIFQVDTTIGINETESETGSVCAFPSPSCRAKAKVKKKPRLWEATQRPTEVRVVAGASGSSDGHLRQHCSYFRGSSQATPQLLQGVISSNTAVTSGGHLKQHCSYFKGSSQATLQLLQGVISSNTAVTSGSHLKQHCSYFRGSSQATPQLLQGVISSNTAVTSGGHLKQHRSYFGGHLKQHCSYFRGQLRLSVFDI